LEDAGVDFGGLLEKFGFVRSGASLNNVASNYEENPYVGERRDDDNTYGIDDKPLEKPLFSPVDLLEMIGTFGIGGLIGKASGKAALRKLFSKFGSEAVSKSSAIPQGPVTSTGSRLVGYAAKPWRYGNEPY
jgi:hypothetical protein